MRLHFFFSQPTFSSSFLLLKKREEKWRREREEERRAAQEGERRLSGGVGAVAPPLIKRKDNSLRVGNPTLFFSLAFPATAKKRRVGVGCPLGLPRSCGLLGLGSMALPLRSASSFHLFHFISFIKQKKRGPLSASATAPFHSFSSISSLY